jgi:bile salt-stimulated lipase
LSTENDVVPGNNGIKDQILALQWIQNNVEYFGGNPDSVTISGMSAGGASVHIHYLSPRSKGLFHRGISQSGTALCPWVLMENPLDKTKRIASKLGCPSGETSEMVDCLRQKPAEEIVSCVKEFLYWLYNPFSPFGVVVDSWSSDPVLPDHPYTLLKKGQVSDLPWIASLTNFEGMYPASGLTPADPLR